jgi:uncharacterized protein YndB with AHSA1/START domain
MARRPLRWVVLVMGLPVLLIAMLLTTGYFLPRDHEAASSARFAVPPDSVWAVISDLEHVPSWRPDVTRMERLPDHDGHAVWLEVGQTGSLPYEVVEWLPPVRLALRIDDPDLPFSGSWIYTIEPDGGGSLLTVVERGAIKNALFRALARFVFGYHSILDGYLRSLGTRLGAEITPRHIQQIPPD